MLNGKAQKKQPMVSNFLPGGEIDYTDNLEIIRLFIKTNSHPENVAAFRDKQLAKNFTWEEHRRNYRLDNPHLTKEELKRKELKVIEGDKS